MGKIPSKRRRDSMKRRVDSLEKKTAATKKAALRKKVDNGPRKKTRKRSKKGK